MSNEKVLSAGCQLFCGLKNQYYLYIKCLAFFLTKSLIFSTLLLTLKVWKLSCGNWQTLDFHWNYTFVLIFLIFTVVYFGSKLCVFSRKKFMFTCIHNSFQSQTEYTILLSGELSWETDNSAPVSTANRAVICRLTFFRRETSMCRARKWRLLIAI